jgi:hypothetical protein
MITVLFFEFILKNISKTFVFLGQREGWLELFLGQLVEKNLIKK